MGGRGVGVGSGVRVGGVRLDVNEELKFWKNTQNKIGGGGEDREGGQVGVWLVGVEGGCERRIEVLGKFTKTKSGGREGGGQVGGRVGGGQGGCERRIEGFCEN